MKKEIGELTMAAEDKIPTIERKINLIYEKLLDIDYKLQSQTREKTLKELEQKMQLIEAQKSTLEINDYNSYDHRVKEEERFEGRY